MTIPVGIDNLNVYASTLSIDFAGIVKARGSFEKEYQNVRFNRRSVMPPYEDPVTLAVNAAKPIVDAAGPDKFDLLIVATETSVDYAKPLSSYVHKYLGLGDACRNFEIKHACYAGTAALQMSAARLRAGVTGDKQALVIMTDTGRRHFNEAAELSVGTGAIALSVSTHPRVFKIEPASGFASAEVYDTARPTSTSEWIDPSLSISSYLDLLEMAWDNYRRANNCGPLRERFAYMVYHTPLLGLVERAHSVLLAGDDPTASKEAMTAAFQEMVQPSLCYNLELGNIYSGTVYLALAGLIASRRLSPQNDRIGCFSYGSGACAELFSGFVGEQAHSIISEMRLEEKILARHALTMPQYEKAILAVEQNLTASDFAPDFEAIPGHFAEHYQGKRLLVLDRVRDYHRSYRWS